MIDGIKNLINEETNPNRMKIHWMNIAKIRKNIGEHSRLGYYFWDKGRFS